VGGSKVTRFEEIPNASGLLARLAYAQTKANGIDPQPLLKGTSLTPQIVNNASLRLRVIDQIRFLDRAADALHDDFLGFHLAQSPDLREFGFLYYVSASSEVLGEALRHLTRYASISNEGVSPKYFDGKDIRIVFHYVGVSRHLDRHQMEFFLTVLIRLCRHLTGYRLIPTSIKLTHHRQSAAYKELNEFFGKDIQFSSATDEISFSQSVNDMPIVSADHHLNKLLISCGEEGLKRKKVKRGSVRSAVENAILPLLPHGEANLEEVARKLGVSRRTLARRLSSEKLTFSAVMEDLKINLSERYLADDYLSVSQVAWLVGYQEVSSFTHAFRRWTGKSPRQVRLATLT
jgi:AraC-like DNA-binding protein